MFLIKSVLGCRHECSDRISLNCTRSTVAVASRRIAKTGEIFKSNSTQRTQIDTEAMAMNNRSQSVSAQLIVSLVAVVAVNSAFWWHRSKLGKEESAQDQKASLRDKKRAADVSKTNSNHSSSSIKGRKLVHLSLMKKDSVKSPKNYIASREMGSKSKRPTIQQINITSIQSRSKKTTTKRAQPRVRESLLPWNNSLQARSVVDAIELQEGNHHPLLQRPQASAAGCKGIVQRQNYQSEEKKPTRVRGSLLPWSARDESMESPLKTEKKPARIPRVRNSLLPESIRQNSKTVNDFSDEGGTGTPVTRSCSHIHEQEQFLKQKSPKLSAEGSTPQDYVTVRSCDKVGEEYPAIRGSIRRENRQPLLARLNDSNVTARSSTTSLSAKAGNKTSSPLRNSSNTKRSRVSSRSRKSSELKEEGWKTWVVSKLPRETIKSPTLLRLSRRQSDASESDVKTLCKVFEHSSAIPGT